MATPSPRDVVNRQLEVYNAHDIDGYCALFAKDATISDLVTGEMICIGLDQIRAAYTKRFADNPKLHCIVHQRMEGPHFAIASEDELDDPPLRGRTGEAARRAVSRTRAEQRDRAQRDSTPVEDEAHQPRGADRAPGGGGTALERLGFEVHTRCIGRPDRSLDRGRAAARLSSSRASGAPTP